MTFEDLIKQFKVSLHRPDFNKAVQLAQKMVKEYPDFPGGDFYLGLAYKGQQKYANAIIAFKKAVPRMSDFEKVYLNLSNVYAKTGQYQQAIDTLSKYLGKNPKSFKARFSLAIIQSQNNQHVGALSNFKKASQLEPNNPQPLYTAGLIYAQHGMIERAIGFFKRTIKIDPAFAPAYADLGNAYSNHGKLKLALEALEKALKIDPNINTVYRSLYTVSRKICDWQKTALYGSRLATLTKSGLNSLHGSIEPPLINLIHDKNPSHNLKVAKFWSKQIAHEAGDPPSMFTKRAINNRIRIGYLSTDYKNHPVGYCVSDLFRYHNKKKFEVFAYSYENPIADQITKDIKKQAEHFFDLTGMEHKRFAQKIANDKIDILVDLANFTSTTRPDIIAYKPAPIQINYLGFPGTTGSPYIDYLIADPIIVPPNEQKYYSEKIIYTPHCYQICSPVKISNKKFKRGDFDLPKDSFVFASFNRQLKIDKTVFNTWIRILKQVPNSILWLYIDNNLAKKNLKSFFKNSGLPLSRLIFATKLPFDQHLARLKLADLSLDTFSYSGGATTAYSLLAGLPVITLYGRNYISRMSSSILINAGLPELTTKDIKEYQDLAVSLATNQKKLLNIKRKLNQNNLLSGLFNSKQFVRDLEENYRQILK